MSRLHTPIHIKRKIYTTSPPPPPPVPPKSNPSGVPTILRTILIIFTLLGLIMAILSISVLRKQITQEEPAQLENKQITHSLPDTQKQTESSQSKPDNEIPIESAGGNKSEQTNTPKSNVSNNAPDQGAESTSTSSGGHGLDRHKKSPPSSTSSQGLFDIDKNKLVNNLANIKDDRKDNPEANIYFNIACNLKYSVKILLTVIESSTKDQKNNGISQDFEKRFKSIQAIENYDTPYYRQIIFEYSRLLAEASIQTADLLNQIQERQKRDDLKKQIEMISNSYRQGACDAALVAALAFIYIGENRIQQYGEQYQLDILLNGMRDISENKTHIIKRTYLSHTALCNALTLTITAWDRKGAHRAALNSIQSELKNNITKAKDNFYKIEAYTNAEASLIMLFATLLK